MESDTDLSEHPLDWNAPSPRLRVLRRYEVVGTTLAALILAAGIAIVLGAGTAAVVAVICVILAGSIADVVAGRRVRAWGYAERAEDLLVRRGVMFRRMSVIPYGRMPAARISETRVVPATS